MMKHGVSPRSHGNLGRIPHNTFSLDNYQFATRFLHAYFEKHAIKDKRQKQGIIKLPKNITFKTIHDAYQAYGAEVNEPSKLNSKCKQTADTKVNMFQVSEL